MQWTYFIKFDELALISAQLNRNLSQTIAQKGSKSPEIAENGYFWPKTRYFKGENVHNLAEMGQDVESLME